MFLMRKIAHLIVVTVLVVVGIACSPFSRTDRTEEDDDTRGRGVPAAAIVAAEGRNEISYRPDQRGTVYLYDASRDELLGMYEVSKGERFTFNPQMQRALVDRSPISVDTVEVGNRHRIYFLPADR